MTQGKGIYRSSSRTGTGRTQKRIGMAVDADLMDWLNQQPNKARYINGLIRQDMEMHKLQDEAKERLMTVGEVMTDHREQREEQSSSRDSRASK